MAFDWLEFMDFAKTLFASPQAGISTEANTRIIVGRAYYAVFNEAKHFLETKDFIRFKREGIHAQVIDQFKDHPEADRQEIGFGLARLFNLRRWADYRANDPMSRADAKNAIDLAEQLMTAIASLP